MMEALPNRLVSIRTVMRETQSKMAESVGMSVRGWQQIERGEAIPSGQTLLKLAELGFDPTWILTGHGSMRLDADGAQASEQQAEAESARFEAARKTLTNKVPKPSEDIPNPHEALRAAVVTAGTDPELLGRVAGMVATIYRQHGIKLSEADAARTAAPYYDRLRAMAATGTENERLALLGVLRVWLDQELTSTASNPSNSKASA